MRLCLWEKNHRENELQRPSNTTQMLCFFLHFRCIPFFSRFPNVCLYTSSPSSEAAADNATVDNMPLFLLP